MNQGVGGKKWRFWKLKKLYIVGDSKYKYAETTSPSRRLFPHDNLWRLGQRAETTSHVSAYTAPGAYLKWPRSSLSLPAPGCISLKPPPSSTPASQTPTRGLSKESHHISCLGEHWSPGVGSTGCSWIQTILCSEEHRISTLPRRGLVTTPPLSCPTHLGFPSLHFSYPVNRGLRVANGEFQKQATHILTGLSLSCVITMVWFCY